MTTTVYFSVRTCICLFILLINISTSRAVNPHKQLSVNLCEERDLRLSNETLSSCYSCQGKCGTASDSAVSSACSCDTSCVLNKDCCKDFKQKCKEHHENTTDFWPSDVLPACAPTKWPPDEDTSDNYLLISSCPFNETLCKVSNLTPNMLIPVFDTESKRHYVNMNCALCNGMCTLTPWQTEITCHDVTKPQQGKTNDVNSTNINVIWNKIKQGICDIQMFPGEEMVPPRKCWKSVKRSCRKHCSNLGLIKKCMTSDLTYVTGSKGIYANRFCLYCNEGYKNLTCPRESRINIKPKRAAGRYSFHLLFDVDPAKGIGLGDETVECSQSDCISYNEHACIAYPPPAVQLTFSINVTEKYENYSSFDDLESDLLENLSSEVSVQNVKITPKLDKDIWIIVLTIPFYLNYDDFQLKTLVSNFFKHLFQDNDVDVELKKKQVTKDLNCTIQELSKSEYKYGLNKTLVILSDERVVLEDSYYIYNDHAYVCLEPWMEVTYPEGFGIVTIVCISVSIAALVTRLILHLVVPKPSTDQTANWFRVSLSISLLSAMVSFLVHPMVKAYNKVCYVVAVWEHWSFLAAFCWMTSIAVDITRMLLASKKLRHVEDKTKSFLLHSLFSWGVPSVTICVTLILDNSTLSWFWKPFYGLSVCWISNRYALLMYFVAPVAFVVATNIILFIMCVVTLSGLKQDQVNTSEQSYKEQLILHGKLLILMGLTWIFGLLAAPLHVDALWYLFIVLNASQGVFLLLIYLSSRQFRKYITECCKARERKKSETFRLTDRQTMDTSF